MQAWEAATQAFRPGLLNSLSPLSTSMYSTDLGRLRHPRSSSRRLDKLVLLVAFVAAREEYPEDVRGIIREIQAPSVEIVGPRSAKGGLIVRMWLWLSGRATSSPDAFGRRRPAVQVELEPRSSEMTSQDFFLDFDPLRCGRCSPHQFVRGLNAIVLALPDQKRPTADTATCVKVPHLRAEKMRVLTVRS